MVVAMETVIYWKLIVRDTVCLCTHSHDQLVLIKSLFDELPFDAHVNQVKAVELRASVLSGVTVFFL